MKGKFIIVSGPSGVGKSTAMKAVRKMHPEWKYPLSVKTRDPRPGEVNGEVDLFISREEFEAKIEAGEFLEWAEYGGNYYGTLLSDIRNGIDNGIILIKEMEIQGYQIVLEKLDRDEYSSIFIMPDGDYRSLITRITDRATLSEEELEKRIQAMEGEMALGREYDYQITSHTDEIPRLIKDLESSVIDAARSHEK